MRFGMKVAIVLSAAITTDTSTTGTSVNMNGDNDFEGLSFTLGIPAGAYTDGDFQLTMEESDDDSVWSAVAAEDITGAEDGGDVLSEADSIVLGYVGKKQYVRPVVVSTNTTSGASAVAVAGIQDAPRSKPLS